MSGEIIVHQSKSRPPQPSLPEYLYLFITGSPSP
jgi:hypothetical protein